MFKRKTKPFLPTFWPVSIRGILKIKVKEQKMRSELMFFSILGLTVIIANSFPVSKLKTYSPGIDSSSTFLLESQIQMEGGTIILYTTMISKTLQNYTIHRVNASSNPPSLLATFSKLFSGLIRLPKLNLMKSRFNIFWTDGSGEKEGTIVRKNDLGLIQDNAQVYGSYAGLYLPNTDTIAMHGISEYAIKQPEGPGFGFSSYYNSGTTAYLKIKTFATKLLNKIFTFYTDRSFFVYRPVTTQTNLMQTYHIPTVVNFGQNGYQCSCLSNDDTLLFVLLPSNQLKIYYLSNVTLKQSRTTPYLNITKCYHDGANSALVFVAETFSTQNSGSSQYFLFSLKNSSVLSSSTLPQLYLTIDKNNNIGTMCSSTQVFLCELVKYCNNGEYYLLSNNSCMACPAGCTTCRSDTNCTACETNYTMNNYTCEQNTTTMNMTTNVTANATVDEYMEDNITSNSTINNTEPIISNNTASNTTNTTPNYTNITNQESSRIFPQSTQPLNQSTLIISLLTLMNNTALSALNEIPEARKALPFLCFLINLDELWLYQYHQTNYGATMSFFFNALQQLENQKWKIVGDDKAETLYNALGTSRSAIQDIIDTKFNYSHTGFVTAEGKGETFLPACWDFLTFNLLFVLVSYCLLRLAFHLLFHYRIWIFLRAFSFVIYLSPLLLDGNLQYFFFLMFSLDGLSFSLPPQDKAFTALGILVYFFILWVSVVSCFLAYYMSRKLAKYVLDNWRTRIYGLFSFSLGSTLRMLVFGAIHSVLRFDVKIQLLTLLIAEVVFISIMCAVMKYWRSHKVEFKAWYTIGFAFLRIILTSVLFIQQHTGVVGTDIHQKMLFESILGVILNLYMLTFYAGTITEVLYEVIQLCKTSKTTVSEISQKKQGHCSTNSILVKQKKQKSKKKNRNHTLSKNLTVSKNVRFKTAKTFKGQTILIRPKTMKGGGFWMVVDDSKSQLK